MVATDVENRVAAQEIEVIPIIHVVEISPLRPGINAIEPDHALRRHQCAIQVPLMQIIIFAQTRGDDLLQLKSHGNAVGELTLESNCTPGRRRSRANR